jgi:large conductance mechanosensitive channel
MWDEFKKFIARGNVMDLAVGLVLGAAFTTIVKSVVDNLIMPPIGILTGGVDFSTRYVVLREAPAGGPFANPDDMVKAGAVLLRYGLVVNAVLSFLIVAAAVFLLVKGLNRLMAKPPPDPTNQDCPRCLMSIPIKATRCGHCTSDLG